ncbi:MAG TPA: 5'-3' exonuclease [Candidatus Binatia bacterium]|nr:5'-3' exonuclease [Candidatus Binatia bacterium]
MQLLVDYQSLLFRTFHTIPASVPMNGVYGFLNMLARLIVDRRPDGLAVAVDEDWRPAFRVDAIPAYKAHRVAETDEPDPIEPQEALGRELLAAAGIAVVGAEGYEAEDVIATLAARAREPVEVVSGDRDLFALVRDPDVRVLYPLTGVSKMLVVDEAEVTRRYGIPGRAYGDFALLRGDPSDGLPGVPGIGEKTAAKLIAEHGSLERLLASRTLAPAVARRLEAAHDYLAAARRVVLPVANVPLPPIELRLPVRPADPETLARLAAAHELATPVGRLTAALADRDPA